MPDFLIGTVILFVGTIALCCAGAWLGHVLDDTRIPDRDDSDSSRGIDSGNN